MKRINISSSATDYLGLWYHPEEHRYISQTLDMSPLRDYKGKIKLVMYKNKFHKNGDNRPSYRIRIMGADAVDAKSVEVERLVNSDEGEETAGELGFKPGVTYISVEDALRIAIQGARMIQDGYDVYDAYTRQDFCDAESAVNVPGQYE